MNSICNFDELSNYFYKIDTWKKLHKGYRLKPDFSKVPYLSEQKKFQDFIKTNMTMISAGWL